MAEKTITFQVPDTLFDRLHRAAELTARSVDEVLINTINSTLVAPPNLPPDLANELAAMHLLSAAELSAAVSPSLLPSEQQRLEQLNHMAGERALKEAEGTEQEALLNGYYRSILRRSQALAILAQRGHSFSPEILSQIGPNNDK